MKLAQDDGAGNGGAGSEPNSTNNLDGEGEGTEETNPKEEKTFTQKEEIKANQDWKESQKTEAEKQSEALTNAEAKAKAEAERANTLEAKVTCLSKGVLADNVDDIVILAKAMISDDVTIDQAVVIVLEIYTSFKCVQQNDVIKGF